MCSCALTMCVKFVCIFFLLLLLRLLFLHRHSADRQSNTTIFDKKNMKETIHDVSCGAKAAMSNFTWLLSALPSRIASELAPPEKSDETKRLWIETSQKFNRKHLCDFSRSKRNTLFYFCFHRIGQWIGFSRSREKEMELQEHLRCDDCRWQMRNE